MNAVFDRLRTILLEEPTGNVRFFFGLIGMGYATFIPQCIDYPMYQLAFQWINPWAWSIAFMVNGISLVFGAIYNNPTRTMFTLEAFLGVMAWGLLGMATALNQGTPGPTFAAAFVACWIYVRYPPWK